MRRSLWILALASILFVVALQPAAAQQGRAYDQALGVYSGLADIETGNEAVLGASFRFRIAGPRASGDSRGGGMRGYLEPEVQYIETDFDVDRIDISGEDLLVGLNLIGVVPFGAVDMFFGGGPTYHFQELSSELPAIDELATDTFGLNIQSGLDVHVGDRIALWVALRLDLLEEGTVDEEFTKILLGLRFKFD